MLCDIFASDLEDIDGTLMKFGGDPKVRGITNKKDGRVRIQRDLDRLEFWAKSNKFKFH